MFYKDGKFDQEAAKQAYIDMMENLGYPISENLRDNMWVSDFALGDFPAVGMGGIFWAQENEHGVFGHEILLLPNQMLIEHWHVAGNGLPAKTSAGTRARELPTVSARTARTPPNIPMSRFPIARRNT